MLIAALQCYYRYLHLQVIYHLQTYLLLSHQPRQPQQQEQPHEQLEQPYLIRLHWEVEEEQFHLEVEEEEEEGY